MKPTYFLGIDTAKHKMRVALSTGDERVLLEKDLPVNETGLRELLATITRQIKDPSQLLVLIEATGLLHLNWSAALSKAGYAVAVINLLIARRLYTLQNSIRDNKSDPIDARSVVHDWITSRRETPGSLSLLFKAGAVRTATLA